MPEKNQNYVALIADLVASRALTLRLLVQRCVDKL